MVDFIEVHGDQARETINSRQRFQAWTSAVARERGLRGSIVWETSKGHDYLFRAYYDDAGKRRQKSLGPRSPETEELKRDFEREREAAIAARKKLDAMMERQAAINRALGLGRLPLLPARILRAIENVGLLGSGLKVVGTHALFAYEAAAGVHLDSSLTATGDIDLLLDARTRLRLIGDPGDGEDGLLGILRRVDRSFNKTPQRFRAVNDDGFLVDLISPMRNPPWSGPATMTSPDDIEPAEIEGLTWLENAPAFEQMVFDARGYPLRLITVDPRVFAVHKSWVSQRPERDNLKRRRDSEQARVVAEMIRRYFPHLPFEANDLRMLPKKVVEDSLSRLKAPAVGNRS